MTKLSCEICGRIKSRSGKPFTVQSLKQHLRDAHLHEIGDYYFELTDMLADDDMPDGAYFALAHELGEL